MWSTKPNQVPVKLPLFLLEFLQRIDPNLRTRKSLSLPRIRELAQQIQSVLLAWEITWMSKYACIGGTKVGEDVKKLGLQQHVVAGTPGRVWLMIKRRNLRTKNVKMLVLDEADEMLSRRVQGTNLRHLPSFTPQNPKSSWVNCNARAEVLDITANSWPIPSKFWLNVTN